jgi:preprotein translocase subunit SecY
MICLISTDFTNFNSIILLLSIISIIPTIIESITQISTFKGLGATSLLILVGVAIDTAKQIQTYLISKNYENIIK